MQRDPDAIVIGAGHNGLTCACYLAREGLRVLVVELRDAIGGLTSTKPLTLDGFMHDEHASGFQLANLSPCIEELGLEARGFERLHPPVNYAHAFLDGRCIRFCRNVDDTCASIANVSEHDAKAWSTLMADYYANKDETVRTMFSAPVPGPVPEALRASVRTWVDETFESDKMKAACAAWSSHFGFAPDDEGGVLSSGFGALIQDAGNDPVRGGMQRLPDALASFLVEHGGEIRTNAGVTRIITRHRRAVGVELHDGTEIRATRLVAASMNPVLVARDLLSEQDLGRDIAAKMGAVEASFAQMTIWLALDGQPEYRCGVAAEETLYIHATANGLSFLEKLYREVRRGELPEEPVILFVNEGAVDPSRVPDGKSSLKVIVLPLPYAIEGDGPGRTSARAWKEVAESYADYVLELAERCYAPGLRARILARAVQDPVAMSMESPDCYRGDVGHLAVRLHQFGASRPIPEMGQYRTPIPNVYLCGSGTHPGPGVTMACGRNAAMTICNDLEAGRVPVPT